MLSQSKIKSKVAIKIVNNKIPEIKSKTLTKTPSKMLRMIERRSIKRRVRSVHLKLEIEKCDHMKWPMLPWVVLILARLIMLLKPVQTEKSMR